MTEFRFSSIIIGIIIASAITAVFSLFMVDIASKNSLDFDNDTINKYNRLEESIALSNNIRKNESDMRRRGGLQDILGDWFEQGYNTLRVSKASFETVDSLAENAAEDTNMGSAGPIFVAALGAIFTIIGVFIIISTLTKRES